jgi:single-strand DNA-binding protein
MADLNEWQGIGRLGKEIELRFLGNGDAVASFSIACDDSYKDKQTGAKVERTEWVRCVAFRQSAEFLAEWLRKGNRVLIKGKLKTREYDKDGVKHYVTEIHADRGTQIIDWPERDQNQTQQQQRPVNQQQQRPAQNSQQQQSRPAGNGQQQQRNQQAAPQPQPDFDSFDDDIPF